MKHWICLLLTLFLPCCCFSVCALNTSARAAVVICGDTGEVLYVQNAEERLPMASTTKIMTALLLCEYGSPEREITVTKEMVSVEGSSMGLLPGDTVTLHDLLYGILLASGNDAANTAATVIGGTVEQFVAMMNDRAAKIGLANTHFVTPSGLDADEHYTTARELALLAREALANPAFAAAAASDSAALCYGNPPYQRTLKNHNRLLQSYDGAIGVKTGFTKKSGRCLVSAAKRDGKYVIAVTLHDSNDWNDHAALLDYGFSRLQTVVCKPKQEHYAVPIIGGTVGKTDISVNPIAASTAGDSEIKTLVLLPEFLYAPLSAGEQIGSVSYYSGEILLEEAPLRLQEDIPEKTESNFSVLWENFKYIASKI